MGYTPKFLGHINIFVRNTERSQKWYEEILGLHTYGYRPGGVAFMAADIEQSHEIALVQVGDDAAGPEKGRVGLNHMAWMMNSLDDLKEAYLRLKDKGVEIVRVGDHGVSIGIYIEDPDGNGVEIGYELPRSEWPREENLFASDVMNNGRFPGPWDELLAKPAGASS